jgi:hypothetical protein
MRMAAMSQPTPHGADYRIVCPLGWSLSIKTAQIARATEKSPPKRWAFAFLRRRFRMDIRN